MKTEFHRVERPVVTRTSLSAALRATLTTGDAVAIPLQGETYAVVRNRKAGTASSIARRLNACVRTMKNEDGQSLLLWLEPKTNGNG